MHIVLMLFVLSFFSTPFVTSACENSSNTTEQKTCCVDQEKSNSKKSSCCDEGCSSEKEKKHECTGNCGHGSCHCNSIAPMHAILLPSKPKHLLFTSVDKKAASVYKDSFLSSGYLSIWLPPKIA